jgi:hypothetical protein
MRRAAVIFGGISGALAVALAAASVPLIESGSYRKADAFGYASMVLSMLLVFFGIRSHREREGGGRITFGRGLLVGVLITLIACACLIVAFELIYFWFVPDFGEKFAACMVQRVREDGGTPQEIETARSQATMFKRLYDNPWTNAAVTFATSFPIGLAASVISAAILRKR